MSLSSEGLSPQDRKQAVVFFGWLRNSKDLKGSDEQDATSWALERAQEAEEAEE